MENRQDLILTETLEKNILQIKLNRPQQLNALNHALLKFLSQILDEAKHDATIKAILLTGEGKAFCAGADIKELMALKGASGYAFARFGQSVFRKLEQLGKPSLAAIQGYAFGGGCELAMSCTLRIASNHAAFSQPEIKLGVIPGFGGTQRLSRLIGKSRALDMCLTGRRMTADEALAFGLVNEVIAPNDLDTRARVILKELIGLSPIAMQSIMLSINQGYDMSQEEGFELEASQFAICCTTKDKQEGVSAFIEKRMAVFSGE